MGFRERIFGAFEPVPDNGRGAAGGMPADAEIFSDEDPFDFFRKPAVRDRYLPKTQAGLRKAFSEGLVGIEYFLQMATSLRPLSDEAQDVNEITRLFSQQKLASRPDAGSVRILRGMIKDPDPEIALYAAEGLNTIENTFINRIQRVRKRLEKPEGRRYIRNFLLGCLYLEFAGIMEGQELIRQFYLHEAERHIMDAHAEKPGNYRVETVRGGILLGLGRFDEAIDVLDAVFKNRPHDIRPLFMMVECCYYKHDYTRVFELCREISRMRVELSEDIESIVYQWIL